MDAENEDLIIYIRQDVDGFVWRIGDCSLEHVSTFPALGYVQVITFKTTGAYTVFSSERKLQHS